MWENARYTIAITEGTTHGLKSTFPSIDFYYYVKGKKYNSNISISLKEHKIQTKGGRYLLVFSNKNFEICEFQYDCIIPDSIINAPSEGWLKPPFNCYVQEDNPLINIKNHK
jgi:hypothetical protein